MPAKAAWMGVDLAEELSMTIGTGDVPVEIETQIVMDLGGSETGTLTVMEHGVGVARLIAMEHGVGVARLIAMEHGVAAARLIATEHGVAVADKHVG
jgi:hypothetical protein